jgi:hypothetical protein
VGLIIRLQRASVASRLNTTSAGVYKTRPLMDGSLRSRARSTQTSSRLKSGSCTSPQCPRTRGFLQTTPRDVTLASLAKPPAPSALTNGLTPSTQESCSSHTFKSTGRPRNFRSTIELVPGPVQRLVIPPPSYQKPWSVYTSILRPDFSSIL